MTELSPTARTILDRVEATRDELVDLTLSLSGLPDRSGFERPVAEAVAGWFTSAGLGSAVDPLSETSANVRAWHGGTDGDPAPRLILSSHLDTEGAVPSGDAPSRRRLRGAWRDGDLLVGKGLINDKTQLAAMMIALRELSGGARLRGDLLFLGTAQECGAPLDPSARPGRDEGPHVGEGFGARWAVEHGLAGSFALVGEPTGGAISGAQAGYLRVRVTVPGFIPYTPFVDRGDDPLATDNPYERAARVIARIADWAREYERREELPFWGGTIVPRAQIQEVRAVHPLYTELDDPCDVYVDIRTRPGRDDASLLAELRDALDGLGFTCQLTPYDRADGYVATGAEPVVEALRRAHVAVFGDEPPPPRPPQVSMWHDSNAFNAAGIPAVSYGIVTRPEPWTRERFRAATVDDLVRLAQVYALVALEVCRDASGPDGDGGAG